MQLRTDSTCCVLNTVQVASVCPFEPQEVPDFSPHRASLEGEVEFPTTSIDAQVSLGGWVEDTGASLNGIAQ